MTLYSIKEASSLIDMFGTTESVLGSLEKLEKAPDFLGAFHLTNFLKLIYLKQYFLSDSHFVLEWLFSFLKGEKT